MNPLYETSLGRAYLADSLEFMKSLPSGTVNLVMTSPPYAAVFQEGIRQRRPRRIRRVVPAFRARV